jgi:hypothetical protein
MQDFMCQSGENNEAMRLMWLIGNGDKKAARKLSLSPERFPFFFLKDIIQSKKTMSSDDLLKSANSDSTTKQQQQ